MNKWLMMQQFDRNFNAYFLMFLCCSFSFLTRSSCALRAFASMVWASVWWACLSAWYTTITANVMVIEIILSDCNTRIAANVILIAIIMSAWNTKIAANVMIIEIIMSAGNIRTTANAMIIEIIMWTVFTLYMWVCVLTVSASI